MNRVSQALLATSIAATLGVAPLPQVDDPHALVARSLAAMGNGHDLHDLAGIKASTTTVNFDIVEFNHPDPPFVIGAPAQSTVIVDLRGGRQVTEPGAPAGGSRRVRILIADDVQQQDILAQDRPTISARREAMPAWDIDEPIRALLVAERSADLRRMPDLALHGIPQHVVQFHDGMYPVRLFIDTLSWLPTAVEVTRVLQSVYTDIPWDAWGDVLDRTEWMNYEIDDGIRYPLQSDLTRNGVHARSTVRHETRMLSSLDEQDFAMAPTSVPINRLHADDVPLNQSIPAGPDPKRPIQEIEPGIVQIPGSWYSTIVKQDDGVVIIDAPISSGYGTRILEEANRRFPGSPVKALITSTSFYWHIGGIRPFAARGIPIYVRDRNVAVVRALLTAPHTLAPDELARSPRPLQIHAVSGPTRIGTGHHAITIFPIIEGEQPMVMTWIADARILHTAEMVQPLGPNGSLILPEALLELHHSVHAAGLDTAGVRMIGMHMSPTPWTTLEEALKAAGSLPVY